MNKFVAWFAAVLCLGLVGAVTAADPGTLEIQTNPPQVAFAVFSGDTFEFSGTTPYLIRGARPGEYTICFERQGYDLFWRTIRIEPGTTTIVVSLRPSGSQKNYLSCIDANKKSRTEEIEAAREAEAQAKRKAQLETERQRDEAAKQERQQAETKQQREEIERLRKLAKEAQDPRDARNLWRRLLELSPGDSYAELMLKSAESKTCSQYGLDCDRSKPPERAYCPDGSSCMTGQWCRDGSRCYLSFPPY